MNIKFTKEITYCKIYRRIIIDYLKNNVYRKDINYL